MLLSRIADITGKQFGKLTVIRYEGTLNGRDMWLCKCDCGSEKVIRGSHLREGRITSCKIRLKLDKGEAALKGVYRLYMRKAKERGYSFKINLDDFRKLTKERCYYCGIEPLQKAKHPKYNGNYIYNGIDRIDNSKGYILRNVVSCCKDCNRAKSNMSHDNFISWIKRIYNNLNL
jgi:hypothetical protein